MSGMTTDRPTQPRRAAVVFHFSAPEIVISTAAHVFCEQRSGEIRFSTWTLSHPPRHKHHKSPDGLFAQANRPPHHATQNVNHRHFLPNSHNSGLKSVSNRKEAKL